MTQLTKNVELKDRTFLLGNHKSCFVAREAIDWLQKQTQKFEFSRRELSILLDMLRKHGI